MFKNTIAGIKRDCKEILPKMDVIRAKAENKLFRVYFKAFRQQQKKNKLNSKDYELFYDTCHRFVENIKTIKGE